MSLEMKPVEVAVLEEVKLNKNKIWVAKEDASDDAEATIRHVSSTLYVLEVKNRGAPNPVIKFDFLKIKSYRMKTNTWHELRYEGDKKFALRFKEGERNFQAFFDQLQVILKLHKMSTKPKYNEEFMKEVRMFKLQMLTPVDKSNRGRKGRSTDDEPCRSSNVDSGMPIRSGSGGSSSHLQIVSNQSGESFTVHTQPRFDANKNSTPQISPQKQPILPRSSNDLRTAARKVEDWQLPSERRDSSDESYSDMTSSDNDSFYSASEHYSDSSTVELQDRRQRVTSEPRSSLERQSPTGNRRPPVPPRKSGDYLNMALVLGRSKPNAPAPPPPNPRANVSLVRTISDVPPQIPAAPHGRPNQGLQRQVSLQDPSSSSSVYGTAQSWRCVRCTRNNLALTVLCASCNWTRTDAWECRNCSIVYSIDVTHCQTCPAWRCRLCTVVNSGTRTDTTACETCNQ